MKPFDQSPHGRENMVIGDTVCGKIESTIFHSRHVPQVAVVACILYLLMKMDAYHLQQSQQQLQYLFFHG